MGTPLMPWQRQVADVALEIDPASGMLAYRTVILTIPRQMGKGLDCRTPLPTPDGWTTIGDVGAGDVLFDENGEQCVVSFVSDDRFLDCYRVDFSDGTHVVADGDHLWSVWDIWHHDSDRWAARGKTRPKGGWVVRSTRELAGTEQIGTRSGKKERRYRLPAVGPIETAEADLPIDPYVFGAWLGDGNSRGAVLTSCGDDVDEMAALIESTGVLVKSRTKDPRKANTWKFRLVLDAAMRDGFESRCRRMGVWGNKHIPAEYLRASVPQRMALLQGLMDTDGTVFVTGTRRASRRCEFSVCSERLAAGFVELARSLGLRVSVRVDPAKLNGVQVNWRWRVGFHTDLPVFRLSRKARYLAEQETPLRVRSRMIEKITPHPTVRTRCIQVDSPSRLFRAGEGMVPTHNTTLLLPVWLQRAVSWPKQNIAWTMQSAKDAREKWEDEHIPVVLASPLERAVSKVRKQNGSEAVIFRNGSIQRLMASTLSSGHGKVLDLGIVDEAFAQPDDRLEQAMRPAMRTRPQPQMWLVSTMGTLESTWFHGWCDAGRVAVESGVPGPVAYFEWSAADDEDPADPATWWRCMPAMGYTVTEDTIRQEYETAMLTADGLAGFRRASLNQRTRMVSDPVISEADWSACLDPGSAPVGPLVLAVDMPPDRSWVSLVVGGRRADGVAHVEVVERRRGSGWLGGELVRLLGAHEIRHVLVAAGGPAGGVLVDVQEACREARPRDDEVLRLVGSGEFTQACGRFFDLVTSGALRHRGQDELDVAVAAAVRKGSGDAWRWARTSTDVDIAPLCGASLVAWGVDALPPPVSREQEAVLLWG